MNNPQPWRNTSFAVPVQGFLHGQLSGTEDCLILTHGAGADFNAPLLVALADGFSASGLAVLRCDLPFRQTRPHGPPPRGSAQRDQQGLRAAVDSVRQKTSGRLFLGGHSYGGRQATMLCAEDPGPVERLLLLSYPLHPPERPTELRTAHFPQLRTPALFVHGERDGFASTQEMEASLRLIPAPTQLLSIPTAGHELANNKNRQQVAANIVTAFQSFAYGA